MRRPKRVIGNKFHKVTVVCPICRKPYTIHVGFTTNGGPCSKCQRKGCK